MITRLQTTLLLTLTIAVIFVSIQSYYTHQALRTCIAQNDGLLAQDTAIRHDENVLLGLRGMK